MIMSLRKKGNEKEKEEKGKEKEKKGKEKCKGWETIWEGGGGGVSPWDLKKILKVFLSISVTVFNEIFVFFLYWEFTVKFIFFP